MCQNVSNEYFRGKCQAVLEYSFRESDKNAPLPPLLQNATFITNCDSTLVNLLKLFTRNTPIWNSFRALFHCGPFERNEISFSVIKCYVNITPKWKHTKTNICTCEYKGNIIIAIAGFQLHSKVSCVKET